jgi:hypothetical protein
MTYQELLAQIEEVERKLCSEGIDPSKGRLGHYRRTVAQLADPVIRADLVRHFGKEGIRPLFFTLTEASELCFIHRSLSFRLGSALLERLKVALGGPAAAVEESAKNSGNRARNVQFELYVMASLLRAGFPLPDQTLTDVRTISASREVLIECKRPQSPTGIRAAVADAVGQLIKQPRNVRPNALKLVALSLGKCLSGGRLLMHAQDENIAKKAIGDAMAAMIQPHIKDFHRKAGDQVAGILAVGSMSMVHLGSNSPSTTTMQILFANSQMNSADMHATEALYIEYKTRSLNRD